MLELAFPIFDQNLVYSKQLVADLTEAQLVQQPVAGPMMNHPAWIIGHNAHVAYYAATFLGHAMKGPSEWKELLGGSSKPQAERSLYPTKVDLLSALEDSHSDLKEAIRNAKPEQLAEPMPEKMRGRFPTVANLLMHILTAHEAVHLGQLSAWRRAFGLPAV